jgi:hypothetical protein
VRHLAAILAGLLCFAIASIALWFNRSALATSMPLLCFIGGFYLLGMLLVIPANMKRAGVQCTQWYRAVRGGGST